MHFITVGAFPLHGKGLILRRANKQNSLSASFAVVIGNFSVNTCKDFIGNKQRKLELLVNGKVVGQFERSYGSGEDTTIAPFIVNDIIVAGNVTITLRLFGSKDNQQILRDDIVRIGFPGTSTSSLSNTTPTEDKELASNATILVDFSTSKFN